MRAHHLFSSILSLLYRLRNFPIPLQDKNAKNDVNNRGSNTSVPVRIFVLWTHDIYDIYFVVRYVFINFISILFLRLKSYSQIIDASFIHGGFDSSPITSILSLNGNYYLFPFNSTFQYLEPWNRKNQKRVLYWVHQNQNHIIFGIYITVQYNILKVLH